MANFRTTWPTPSCRQVELALLDGATLGGSALVVAAYWSGETARHRHVGTALQYYSAIYRVSNHRQYPLKSFLVLDAPELLYGFDKAEELPPGPYRKLHPWQFVQADRVSRSAGLSARPALWVAEWWTRRWQILAAIGRLAVRALDDSGETVNNA